jgi:hypothetical protein
MNSNEKSLKLCGRINGDKMYIFMFVNLKGRREKVEWHLLFDGIFGETFTRN